MKSYEVKILHVISTMDDGGVEMMLKNYFYEYDNKYQHDFMVHGKHVGTIEHTMNKKFIIYHIPSRKKSLLKSIFAMINIVKNGNYTIIHSHLNAMSIFPLLIAFFCKVKYRFIHVHGLNKNISLFKKLFTSIINILNFSISTHYWSCGRESAEFFYKSHWNKKPSFIMYNAIYTDNFRFDIVSREIYRERFDIKDKIVLLYVARLVKGKNQEFIIKLMKNLSEKFCLLLIGDGPDKNYLLRIVDELKLFNKIKMLGKREDISEIMSASDIFVFPSLNEGLGIVAIEAQCSGLPVIASVHVPKDTKITSNIEYLDLINSNWIESINKIDINNDDRCLFCNLVNNSYYSIDRARYLYSEQIFNIVNNGEN